MPNVLWQFLVADDGKTSLAVWDPGPHTRSPTAAMSPAQWKDFRVLKKTYVTHDTQTFRLQVPNDVTPHFPVCGHIKIAATTEDGERICRSYTPIAVCCPSASSASP